ncbi:hypothetical protein C0989_012099 [Termitomyces sp. Mn162]|nr:hypothetical protein C0989_012099 [Termitomyces sp. Mn162]
MIDTVVSLGCKVLPGKSVRRITRNTGGKTNGVECEDGTFYEAATVIIASGSWTPSTFPDPTRKGIVKMAMHLAGYTHSNGGEISRPRTIIDDPIRGLAIPKYNVQQLRTHLRMVYPELAGKPFSATRLCWYNDSPDGNWIIGRVPGDPSLILATAGSGHAYKFLPVIGRLVADTVDGTIDPEVAAKFSIERSYVAVDESRLEMAVAELDLDQLCTLEDLQINSKT